MTLNDVLSTWMRPDVLPIAVLAFISGLLWNIPIIKLLFYPFRILNVFIHELSHGFVAAMTGGEFRRFVVNLEISGTAYRVGGVTFFVAQAGYLGTALVGAFLMLLTTANIPARVVLLGLGLFLGLLCLLCVANCFGIVAGWTLAGLLLFAGSQLDDESAAPILLFLVVQMSLAAVQSLFELIQYPKYKGLTDAEKMEAITAVPAVFWALLWCAIAIAILLWSVTVAYRDLPLPR